MSTKKGPVKYKKAPQAPRRFKSSYMFFSTEKHRSIRQELAEKGEIDKLSTTDVAKLVSQAWRDLSNEERDVWEDMARKDKARYEMEKSMYTGPWKVPAKKRSQKDPNAPKRPMSAFLSFSNSKRAYVKEKHPNVGNAEISRILAQMWKDASPEERKDHVDREFQLRQEYKTAIAEWRRNSESEIQAARKEREDQAMKAVLEGKPLGGGREHSSYPDDNHQEQDVDHDSRGLQQDDGYGHGMAYGGHHVDIHNQPHSHGQASHPPPAQLSRPPYYAPPPPPQPSSHQHSYYHQQHAHAHYATYYNEHPGYMNYHHGGYPPPVASAVASGAMEQPAVPAAAGYGESAYYPSQMVASLPPPSASFHHESQYQHPGYSSSVPPPYAMHRPSHHDGSSHASHPSQDPRYNESHHHPEHDNRY